MPPGAVIVAATAVAALWARRAGCFGAARSVATALAPALLLAYLLPYTTARLVTRSAATPAPRLTSKMLDHSELGPDALAGHVVVLSFWADGGEMTLDNLDLVGGGRRWYEDRACVHSAPALH